MKIPFSSVDNVRPLDGNGPWTTKSGGILEVLFQLPLDIIQNEYLKYSHVDNEQPSKDVRGLRAYTVSAIPRGTIGANEWHKHRNELVFALEGSVMWSCEDVNGRKKQFILKTGEGVWTPPYILHTYKALEDKSKLLVIASTLFLPDDPSTHDSYSIDEFLKLR